MYAVNIGDFELAEEASEWIERIAVTVIAAAVAIAIVRAIVFTVRRDSTKAFDVFKKSIAGGLMLGLDLLIAADIIRTVTLDPTLENVTALGVLVVVRTFLGWTLVLEAENRWPWQRPSDASE